VIPWPHPAVRKTRSISLNNARAISEKIEGLAWGPDLPDGRRQLYVISDNDLLPNLPTQIFAFGIDESKLAAPQAPFSLQKQVLHGPLFPPEQVKQALKK
jgi:Esterase-like activity of phytase